MFVHLQKYPHFWCLPGGKVEDGEQLEKALTREFVEELGVEPTIERLLYVHQFRQGDIEQLEFIFLVAFSEQYLSVNPENTSHGAQELAEVKFINPALETVLPKFLPSALPISLQNQTVEFYSYL